MNYKEYQKIINKTAVYPKEMGIGYTVLGLIGETDELLTALIGGFLIKKHAKLDNKSNYREAIAKEIGDVLWYIAATCNELNIHLQEVFIDDTIDPIEILPEDRQLERFSDPILLAAELAEKAKKYLRDKAAPDKNKVIERLQAIYVNCKSIAEYIDYDIETVMQMNYDKLIKRRETGTLHGSGDNRENEVDKKIKYREEDLGAWGVTNIGYIPKDKLDDSAEKESTEDIAYTFSFTEENDDIVIEFSGLKDLETDEINERFIWLKITDKKDKKTFVWDNREFLNRLIKNRSINELDVDSKAILNNFHLILNVLSIADKKLNILSK
jgi:NTP pyrophosphatase (non-canonical NTP hydrolase)